MADDAPSQTAAASLAPRDQFVRFGLSLAAAVFVLDQASKWFVLEVLKFSPPGCLEAHVGCQRIEISPVFDLSMVWNYGVSFGLLRADGQLERWGLVALSVCIAGVFAWWLRTAERRMAAWALGLVIGGALGNVIDRIRFGAVADFFDFSGPWFGVMLGNWPLGFPWVFNVADAAITVGALLLAADFLLHGEEGGPGAVKPNTTQAPEKPQ
jgi:signal peptidase II